MPADAAEAAAEASFWQLERAVLIVESLVPVQLEPTVVRLVMALATVAATAPSTVMVSLLES